MYMYSLFITGCYPEPDYRGLSLDEARRLAHHFWKDDVDVLIAAVEADGEIAWIKRYSPGFRAPRARQ